MKKRQSPKRPLPPMNGFLAAALAMLAPAAAAEEPPEGLRIRDLGVKIGILPIGPNNAITDVQGVRVGHVTLRDGPATNTGATVIFPHAGNLFRQRPAAGLSVFNGFGKLAGSTQLRELGEIETPIVLTNTLAVAEGMKAGISWTLEQPGNEEVYSVNAVVGETNDGYLNDIRAMTLTAADIGKAFETAEAGPVAEGNVGAGTGTVAFGWKGGIGTSSRILPGTLGGYTVGVLVQSNFGGVLTIAGAPVGLELDQYYLKDALPDRSADGSIMIVVATDAPLSALQLERLAARSFLGLARTGAAGTNGSGDYAIAFSVAGTGAQTDPCKSETACTPLANSDLSPLFLAAAEAAEEAILNSLTAAAPVDGHRGRVEALPIDSVRAILTKHGIADPAAGP
jgi:D-aminopeptidase